MDPNTHPNAMALASCQVQFCFSAYSTISSSLGGHTVGEDDGAEVGYGVSVSGGGTSGVGDGVSASGGSSGVGDGDTVGQHL